MVDGGDQRRFDPDPEMLEEYPQRSDGHELSGPEVSLSQPTNPRVERLLIAGATGLAAILAVVLVTSTVGTDAPTAVHGRDDTERTLADSAEGWPAPQGIPADYRDSVTPVLINDLTSTDAVLLEPAIDGDESVPAGDIELAGLAAADATVERRCELDLDVALAGHTGETAWAVFPPSPSPAWRERETVLLWTRAGSLLNAEVAAAGLAASGPFYDSGPAYDSIAAAERSAAEAGLGIWGTCN